jgi:hypothetical protein
MRSGNQLNDHKKGYAMDSRSGVESQGHVEALRQDRCETEMQMMEDLAAYFRRYARERPGTVALACLGLGFILGWKLKPW